MNLKKIFLNNKTIIFPLILLLISAIITLNDSSNYSTLVFYILIISTIYFIILINIFFRNYQIERNKYYEIYKQQNFLANGVRNLNVDFFILDLKGEITFSNSILYNEYVGKFYQETKFKEPIDTILSKMPITNLKNLNQQESGIMITSKNGSKYWYSIKPIFLSNNLSGFFLIIDNLTHKTQYIKQKNVIAKLWNTILDRSVKTYKTNTDTLVNVLDKFTSDLLIQDNHANELKELEFLIKKSYLNVENLKEYIFKNSETTEFIPVSKLVKIITLDYKNFIEQHNKKIKISLNIDENELLKINWKKFKLALDNIIFNFIEHSNSCKTLEVDVSKKYSIQSSSEELSISFINIKSKIDDELFKKIKTFNPTDISTNNSLGIGLSVCHSIIKNFNGYIELKNLNSGFSLNIQLPLINEDI